MSLKLIIAEKPSVAADIARALGGFSRKGDYFEGDEYNEWDPWWSASLTIRLEPNIAESSSRPHQRGVFDIALRRVQDA